MPEIKTGGALDASLLTALGATENGTDAAKALSKRDVKDAKDLSKAANGFEALLLQQMMKSMWETVDSTGLLGENSNEAQIYRDMLNQAVADNTAKGSGIGVKKMLLRELNSKHPKEGPAVGETAGDKASDPMDLGRSIDIEKISKDVDNF